MRRQWAGGLARRVELVLVLAMWGVVSALIALAFVAWLRRLVG